jgi:hypothetical protein
MHRLVSAFALLLVGWPAFATDAVAPPPLKIKSVNPKTAERGQQVVLIGTGFTSDMKVYWKPVGAPEPVGTAVVPLEVSSDTATASDTATVDVPKIPFGSYLIGVSRVDAGAATYASVSDALKIGSAKPPHITSIVRDPAYPEDQAYKIRILGTGFSDKPEDNTLSVAAQQLGGCGSGSTAPCADATKASGRELEFTIKDGGAFYGRQKVPISIIVDEKESNSIDIRLSRVWSSVPLSVAFLGAVALVVLLIFLSSVLKHDPAAPAKATKWDVFFMDPQTKTYSLSKLQFYLWTFATVFGYLYLATARGLVQGVLDFSDIPAGLPAVLGISAATSALAIGVTNVRGSKGSGDIGPSRADFLTTGGVVAADRVQFLVWTVVGVITFLVLVTLRDPGTIADLPAVPQGFLLLMGVSSAGYLGGKLARKPGPKTTEIKVTSTPAAPPAAATLKLEIVGEHLSRNAKLLIGTDEIGTDDYAVNGALTASGGTDPDFATLLTVTLKNDKAGVPRWAAPGKYELTVVNSDGQRAVKEFTV